MLSTVQLGDVRRWRRFAFLGLAISMVGCSDAGTSTASATSAQATPDVAPASTSDASGLPTAAPTTTAPPTTVPNPRFLRPDWLGTRVLPEFSPGSPYGQSQPTPEVMADRRFATVDMFPAPTEDVFTATVGPVPDDVVARSTYTESCPVGLDGLSYVQMTFWGFDEQPHTGEMILNADIVDEVLPIFELMYNERFAIEEMRVMTTSPVPSSADQRSGAAGVGQTTPTVWRSTSTRSTTRTRRAIWFCRSCRWPTSTVPMSGQACCWPMIRSFGHLKPLDGVGVATGQAPLTTCTSPGTADDHF
jgi:hypothetical protein